jgi:hypothetical protein
MVEKSTKRIRVDARTYIQERIEVDPDTGCWVWQFGTHDYGYGKGKYRGPDGVLRTRRMHRLAYEEWIGPVPDGLFVCHTCDNPPCCNPDHLFAGTQVDNMQDMIEKHGHPESQKTHCPYDHPYSGYNLMEDDKGHRRCRTCHNADLNPDFRAGRITQAELPLITEPLGSYQGQKTRCPQDHPYDEENTRIDRSGRHCRTCDRERDRGRKR